MNLPTAATSLFSIHPDAPLYLLPSVTPNVQQGRGGENRPTYSCLAGEFSQAGAAGATGLAREQFAWLVKWLPGLASTGSRVAHVLRCNRGSA
jgi:hypothetical protein